MTYIDLLERKIDNRLPDFNEFTEKDFYEIYADEYVTDGAIAKLFGLTKEKVRYQRQKRGVMLKDMCKYAMLNNADSDWKTLNGQIKEQLFRQNFDELVKAIVSFVYRSGPIEDIHAEGRLSQDDMMRLNKHMINRLAYIMKFVADEKWISLYCIAKLKILSGDSCWGNCELDDGGITPFIDEYIDEAFSLK